MISLLPFLSYNLLQNGPKYLSAWKKFGLPPGRMRKEEGEGQMLMFSTAFIENTCVHSKGLTGMREEGCGISMENVAQKRHFLATQDGGKQKTKREQSECGRHRCSNFSLLLEGRWGGVLDKGI